MEKCVVVVVVVYIVSLTQASVSLLSVLWLLKHADLSLESWHLDLSYSSYIAATDGILDCGDC